MRLLLLAACLALAACGGSNQSVNSIPPTPAVTPANLMTAAAWNIGPTIAGQDYSVGMPAHPTSTPDGFAIDLPMVGGHADYITTPYGSLTGKSQITMTYRVDLAPGAQIEPTNYPTNDVSEITLFFQRAGDNWSAVGNFESYRWYATFATDMPITAGVHTISAPLDGAWTAVLTSTAENNPAGFADAKANAASVGFGLGGGTGVAHGVFATGQARITVTDFEVQ